MELLRVYYTARKSGGFIPSSSSVTINGSSTKVPQNSVQSHNPPQVQKLDANLNPDQVKLLQYQLLAYRYLSRNMPVPQALKEILSSQLAAKDIRKTSPIAQKVSDVTLAKIAEANQQIKKMDQKTESFSVDFQLLNNSEYLSNQRLIVPALMPAGLDPVTLSEERESRIKTSISARIIELENFVNNLNSEKLDPELAADRDIKASKIKALIELKSLRLLEKQKKVRQDLITGMSKSTTLLTALSRSDYRRVKKPSVREIRMTEKMERQQRMEREKKEKQKHYEYLNSILSHGREIYQLKKSLVQKQMKLGRAVVHWHINIEREEQKRQERITRERINALKADDEEAYLKLIDKQKDTRLAHLLSQTDQYLDQLSSLVAAQQEQVAAEELASGIKPTDFGMSVDPEIEKEDYYQVAHKVKEKVSEQPRILVGGTLKDYQIKGLEWMVSLYNNKLNGILADEMGLGKTIQTISLITYLIEKKRQNGPFLIIVPLSTMTNWNLEFDKWAPSVVKVVYKGAPNVRKSIQATEMRHGTFNVVLTTYEYVIKDKSFLGKIKWIHTIIDEGHRMKNAQSKLSVTLSQHYYSRYRLILTGTPLQNNLPELWALLNFVLPRVFNSVKSFDEWFNTPFANTGEKIELNEEEQLLIIKRLHKVLRPFLLRRLKSDVESDLPEKTERVLKTSLSALQQKLYNQIRRSGAMAIDTSSGKKSLGIRGINNTVMQLRKVCNHPYVFEEVEDVINPDRRTDDSIYRTSGKFELLNRILPKFFATSHRVLIFFQMTAVMDIMEDFLRFKGFKYLRLDGSTKAEDRSALLKLFNAPGSEYFIFILSTRAGGLGLNLQSADTVIIFDSDWNPHQDLQAQDRAHRIGQTKEVRILRLISVNSVEETILARAQYKLDLDGKVIQAGKFDNKSTNEEREAFLRTLLQADPEEANDVNDVEDDDELNEIIARSEEERLKFQEIDEERRRQESQNWKALGRKGEPSSLMTISELPEIYRKDTVQARKPEDPETLGRGRRAKSDIIYNDGLSDDAWAKAIDNEKDIDQLIQKKRDRREKRKSRSSSKRGSSAESLDDQSLDSMSQSSDASYYKKMKQDYYENND